MKITLKDGSVLEYNEANPLPTSQKTFRWDFTETQPAVKSTARLRI